ncbi:OLC1v1025552C1 [Oldenlandia corymbosa var. corymbosa]|uniref:Probable purine permease n=1 Tax=Oldenlandia corymbosa var. corymbosa TaxID=529605 RepID=A0AAV1C5L2_OLDCO|nr:OLC1v1025552C1 [Oldenlandia corymbosa var. corymbosa]
MHSSPRFTSPLPDTDAAAAIRPGYHEVDTQSESSSEDNNNARNMNHRRRRSYMKLLIINYIMLFIGSVSSSLLSKFYFNHKGNSKWVSTWVQSAGFPLLLFPIFLPYYLFKTTTRKPFKKFSRKILLLSVVVGLFLGLNNLLFSWGVSYLPVSTSSLLLSTQLVFTLILSVIIVKQRINFKNLNCVILLSLSVVLLALGSDHDKADGLSKKKYFIGFISTVGAGLLFALYLPVMELIYREVYCYSMVMEMQLIMEIGATAFATAGMAADGGFAEMRNESLRVFDLGEKAYWWTIWFNVVTWQLCFMGTAGMVFLTTGLTGGICMTALLSMNVVGGVVVYGDHFGGVKAVSTVLCVWGFCSYVYGMYVRTKKGKEMIGVNGGDDDRREQPVVEMAAVRSQRLRSVVDDDDDDV